MAIHLMRLLVVFGLAPLARTAPPLKVVLMAGQSNMQGHGYANWHNAKGTPHGTLEQLVASNPKEYSKLKNGNKWTSRKDVWIYYSDDGSLNPGYAEGTWWGELTVGFAGNGGRTKEREGHLEIGPELGFGWALGDELGEQVLLLKTAWGGKDIDVDYRPPSRGGTTGWFYHKMVNEVRSTLKNLTALFPSYSGSYELAGFAWHQGWNDACGVVGGGPDTPANCKQKHHCRKPDPSKYEQNLVALIKDLRKEFSDLPGGSKLPVTIGVSGMLGWNRSASGGPVSENLYKYIIPAQLAVGNAKDHPEFAGNVLSTETRDFYRPLSVSPGTQSCHWHNNCESYWLLGQAMGRNMAKLIGGSPPTLPAPPSPSPPGPSPTPQLVV